jgi:hypothetical protein
VENTEKEINKKTQKSLKEDRVKNQIFSKLLVKEGWDKEASRPSGEDWEVEDEEAE